MDKKTMEKYDSHKIHEVYDNWPQIARDSYTSDLPSLDFKDIDHVVFIGMGGSGTVSDIFKSILSQTNIHTTVVKGYALPKVINKNTLVVAITASGNTDETISALRESLKYDCNRVALSAGGRLESFAKKNGIDHYPIHMHLNPRTTLPSVLYTALNLLGSTLFIDESMINSSIDSLDEICKDISSQNINGDNPSIDLATWMSHDAPIIYYPHGLQSIATRFKNSIHENMKQHAFTENVIEACHNQIVTLENPTSIKAILLRGDNDHAKTIERWDIIKQILEKQNIDYKDIFLSQSNILSKIICGIYRLDYATIYGAVMSGVDPYPVHFIDYIKKQLKMM